MDDLIPVRMGGHVSVSSQVRRLTTCEGLAFSGVLTAAMVGEALQRCGVEFRDRVFNPAVTLWAFVWQTLSADHTCGDAVARVVAWRVAQGRRPCSANTGSYCQARARLPLQLLRDLLRHIGAQLHAQMPADWRWKGRSVKVVDGTTVSMPDTKANQRRFPQPRTQKPGLGFPLARLVAIFSLECGAALDLAVGAYKGKKTGENSLFRGLMGRIEPGDAPGGGPGRPLLQRVLRCGPVAATRRRRPRGWSASTSTARPTCVGRSVWAAETIW